MHESRAAGHWRPACTDRTVAVVPPTTATPLREGQPPQLSDDETWLTQRAAEGDSAAFARLYDRYERRAYNLCYRITGSRDDAADATQETFLRVLERLPRLMGRELQFGPYLLTAARHASYDAIARRRRAAPSAEIPDSAVPVGSGEPEPDRPERQVLLEAHQEQIRAANATLPTRQREALALRELEELSYDEIAEIMGMNRNSVAQLLSRARIGLRDGLRRSALGSIASASPDCERALPLLALRQDGALDRDAAWLTQHLSALLRLPGAGGGDGRGRRRLPAVAAAGAGRVAARRDRQRCRAHRGRLERDAAATGAPAGSGLHRRRPCAAPGGARARRRRRGPRDAAARGGAGPRVVDPGAVAHGRDGPRDRDRRPRPHRARLAFARDEGGVTPPRQAAPGARPRHAPGRRAARRGARPSARTAAYAPSGTTLPGWPTSRRPRCPSTTRPARSSRAATPRRHRRAPVARLARTGRATTPRLPGTPALLGAAVRARRLGAGAAVLPAVPTRRAAAAARRLSRTAVPAPTPAPTCPPRPLGPDRPRDGGEAAPGSPEGGRARPSP